jgi:hypothetical protein
VNRSKLCEIWSNVGLFRHDNEMEYLIRYAC